MQHAFDRPDSIDTDARDKWFVQAIGASPAMFDATSTPARCTTRPDGADHGIQTRPDVGWFVDVRIHGPEASAFDGTWQLPDFDAHWAHGVGPGAPAAAAIAISRGRTSAR